MEIYKVLKQFTFLGDQDAFAVDDVVALPASEVGVLVTKGYLEVVE